MSKLQQPIQHKPAKSGPLYTPLERYDPEKHSNLDLPPVGGILAGYSIESRAVAFRLMQQQAKFSDACLAMGISVEDRDAGDKLLAMFCAAKWPKGFKEAPEKKNKPLTRKQQAALNKVRGAFNLFLQLAGPIHKATGKTPEVKAVAEAILKGGSDKFANGIDAGPIFRRRDVTVTSYRGKHVRAIPAPDAGRKSQSFFDEILAAARSSSGAIIDYITLEESGGALVAKGPIVARFMPSAAISALAKRASVKAGDALFFVAEQNAQSASKLAAVVRTEVGTKLGVNFNQFAGLKPTTKYGNTVQAVLGRINRGGKENNWQPVKELRTWGPDISTLTANAALVPLDKLADCDEPLTIVGNNMSPIAWAIYRRVFKRGGNVDLASDLAPTVLADFEGLVRDAEKERDARGKLVNPAGIVLVDASLHESDYLARVQAYLAECGLAARIVKDTRYCFLSHAPKISNSVLPVLPRVGGNPYYLVNLRAHVPETMLRAGKAAATPDTERPTSYRARKRAEQVADYMEMMTRTAGTMSPYSGSGTIGLLGVLGNSASPVLSNRATE